MGRGREGEREAGSRGERWSAYEAKRVWEGVGDWVGGWVSGRGGKVRWSIVCVFFSLVQFSLGLRPVVR